MEVRNFLTLPLPYVLTSSHSHFLTFSLSADTEPNSASHRDVEWAVLDVEFGRLERDVEKGRRLEPRRHCKASLEGKTVGRAAAEIRTCRVQRRDADEAEANAEQPHQEKRDGEKAPAGQWPLLCSGPAVRPARKSGGALFLPTWGAWAWAGLDPGFFGPTFGGGMDP